MRLSFTYSDLICFIRVLSVANVFCPRLLPTSRTYFPNMTQSPCAVPMKRSNGKDSHAFVREAIKAWRASSGGAAGPVPAVAAMIRLLLGQMMPQTLSIITMPYAPPMPIEYDLLLAYLSTPTVNSAVNNF